MGIARFVNAALTVQRPGYVTQADGSSVPSPTTAYEAIPVSRQPVTGEKQVIDGQPVQLATHRFYTGQQLDLHNGDILSDGTDTWEYLYSAVEARGSRSYTVILGRLRRS